MLTITEIIQGMGAGHMNNTAYDTSWIARLQDIDDKLSLDALQWICENQLPDGSWGAPKVMYYHDRIISTLSAMLALIRRGRRASDKWQIEKGLIALEKVTAGATRGLAADPNGATVGFELIVPTLIHEAEELGIIKKQGDRILGRMKALRKEAAKTGRAENFTPSHARFFHRNDRPRPA
jgi:halimadienyl-diphosphate synthase